MSDGTVHLPAHLTFDWVPALAAGATVVSTAEAASGGSGLVIVLDQATEPALRLRLLGPAGAVTYAGLPGDPIGAAGVVWVREIGAAPADFVGPSPHTIHAQVVRAGVLRVGASDLVTVFGGRVPGGVVVVIPP